MKIMISFLSGIVILVGVMKFFQNIVFLNNTTTYSIILIVLGLLLALAAFMNSLLMGLERFFLIIQAASLLVIASLAFLPDFLIFLPRDGVFYPAIVIGVGLIGFIYGILGLG